MNDIIRILIGLSSLAMLTYMNICESKERKFYKKYKSTFDKYKYIVAYKDDDIFIDENMTGDVFLYYRGKIIHNINEPVIKAINESDTKSHNDQYKFVYKLHMLPYFYSRRNECRHLVIATDKYVGRKIKEDKNENS